MLYSLLYGNKPKPKTTNLKLFKVAIQREQVVINDVPQRRVPAPHPNLPCPLELSNGDDLILCEATKMVEDMINNITLYPPATGIKTYPRKRKKIAEKFGNDSKIFQNIIQLSNIYSQTSSSTIPEIDHQNALCINCPEVDPDAHKFENNFEFHQNDSKEEVEDIFSFYDPVEIKNEPITEEQYIASSKSVHIRPEVNLHEYIPLDENHSNWYDIYHRINDEHLRENLNNDNFLNFDGVNKKFSIKIGSTLRLINISITDIPNNWQSQNEEHVEHKLFEETNGAATSSKRRYDSEDTKQSASKKHLQEYQSICNDNLKIENIEGWNNIHLLDEDDTFVNAIKLPLPTANEGLINTKIEHGEGNNENWEPIEHIQQNEPSAIATSVNNTCGPFINKCFDGFQTGHGKPIDLPKNNVFKKYLQLYENMDITQDNILSA